MKKLLNVDSKKCEHIPDSVTDSMDMNLSKLQEIVKDREGSQRVGHDLATEKLLPSLAWSKRSVLISHIVQFAA